MPDQYDPKQAPRSPYGRPAERRAAPAEDPLAELARMVHGRPGPAAQPVTRPARQAEPAAPGDLESELLNDLQASFAAVREAAAQPAAPPRAQPFVAPPAPTPPEPPRSRPQAPEPTYLPSSFVPRPQPQPAPPPPRLEPRPDSRPEVVRPEFRLEPFDESRLVPIPQPPVIQPSVPPGYAERVEQRAAATEALPRLFDRAPRQNPPSHEDEEFAAFQLRPSTPATAAVTTAPAAMPPAAPPPAAPSRWEQPPPAEPHTVASRFAPPSASEPEQLLDFDDDEGPDPFAEVGLFPQPQLPNDDEFQSDEFGLAPDYAEADEDPYPPLDEDMAAAKGARARPPRGLMIVAAVVAVALVGGLAVAMFRSGQNTAGAPATILADGAPTKITPDDTASPASTDADAQNKLIYDRVNSAEANNHTTLLTPDTGPIKDTSQSDANNAISRVILPGGPGYDQPAGSNAAPTSQPAPPTEADDALGPRKVRTVVVKPDGTILSTTASDAPAADDSAAAAPTTATNVASAPAPAAAAPAPVTDDMAAISGTDGNSLSITTDPDAASAPAIPPPPAPAAKVSEAPAPAPVKKPAQVAQAPATTIDENGPLDLTPGGKAGNAQPATAADGVFVQVSSQRTEDAARATYKDLQTRYPSILGKYGVDLQQADVPSRGTFYRVRVGPFSATDAQRLCDDLRSAGGDCVLARR